MVLNGHQNARIRFHEYFFDLLSEKRIPVERCSPAAQALVDIGVVDIGSSLERRTGRYDVADPRRRCLR